MVPLWLTSIHSPLHHLASNNQVWCINETYPKGITHPKIFLFTPFMSDSRVSALADLLGLFYIAQTGIVAAYMGATAYMAGKPMGNKIATKKDMR